MPSMAGVIRSLSHHHRRGAVLLIVRMRQWRCVANDLIESLSVDTLSDPAAVQEYAMSVSLAKCNV